MTLHYFYRIPPVYERSTASNISLEQGGELNLLGSCGPSAKTSAATHGVRLKELEAKSLVSPKLENIHRLNTTTVSNPLAEIWPLSPTTSSLAADEDNNRPLFCWEENFLDLTDWCAGTTVSPSECGSHAGELSAAKITGTRNLDNAVSNMEKGVSTYKIPENFDIPNKTELINTTVQPAVKQEEANVISNASYTWLEQPAIESTYYQKMKTNNSIVHSNTCSPSFEINIKDDADVVPNLDIGNDNFDLLSYLCEDEESTSTTIISTNSLSVSQKINEEEVPNTRERHKRACRSDECQSLYSPESISSTSTSTPISVSSRAQRRSKKRRIHCESEDGDAYDVYRESREKNNEASRRSRMNKKAKEYEMIVKAERLEKDNVILKMKVEELEKLVTAMRTALLKSALRRNS